RSRARAAERRRPLRIPSCRRPSTSSAPRCGACVSVARGETVSMASPFDIPGLLRQAQQMQERLAGVQGEPAAPNAGGAAGGGLVTVTINGRLEVLNVRLEPSLLESPDVAMLEDLIAAATNAAIRAAQQMMSDEMSRLTGGLKLPGMP